MNEFALQIEQFTKDYNGFKAVDKMDLSIKKGTFFGFLGPNGAGKTTTIKCITGISVPTSGKIQVFGTDAVKNYREARQLIGLSPQEFNVDIFAPVEKILWYIAGFYGVPRSERSKKIESMLDQFELQPHRKKQFRQLSGGLKRRVMLARAMIHDPELLILDEPTAGVDVELRLELWKFLRELNAKGKTILLTSHYLEEVDKLCSEIAIINKGKIVAKGKKEEFTDKGNTLEERYLEITKSD